MKPFLSPLVLLALSAPLPGASQAIPRRTLPDSSTVCIPAAAARRIDADLRRYPLVLSENHRLRSSLHASAGETAAVRRALSAKDSVVAATGSQLVGERMLRSNAEGQTAVWKAKAKGRFWLLIGETLAVVAGALLLAR